MYGHWLWLLQPSHALVSTMVLLPYLHQPFWQFYHLVPLQLVSTRVSLVPFLTVYLAIFRSPLLSFPPPRSIRYGTSIDDQYSIRGASNVTSKKTRPRIFALIHPEEETSPQISLNTYTYFLYLIVVPALVEFTNELLDSFMIDWFLHSKGNSR